MTRAARGDRRPGRGDAGAVAVEWAILAPLLILAFLLVVQTSLASLAETATLLAADEGAQAARVDGGDPAAGRQAALDLLASIGPGLVAAPRAQALRGPDLAETEVSGRAVATIPGWAWRVEARAVAPTERFR